MKYICFIVMVVLAFTASKSLAQNILIKVKINER
jgi:hypothetical protein